MWNQTWWCLLLRSNYTAIKASLFSTVLSLQLHSAFMPPPWPLQACSCYCSPVKNCLPSRTLGTLTGGKKNSSGSTSGTMLGVAGNWILTCPQAQESKMGAKGLSWGPQKLILGTGLPKRAQSRGSWCQKNSDIANPDSVTQYFRKQQNKQFMASVFHVSWPQIKDLKSKRPRGSEEHISQLNSVPFWITFSKRSL